MKRVLCYGDSNTWGYATEPRPDNRYGPSERWPGVLAAELGQGWTVVEEGLNGRTTVHADPVEGRWLDGSAYLTPCLLTHRPLDAVVIMLGTNDLKARFGVGAAEIANSVGRLIDLVDVSDCGPGETAPEVLMVAPPPLIGHTGQFPEFADMFRGGFEKSQRFAAEYRRVANEYDATFIDAGAHAVTSPFDGIHLDVADQASLGRAIAQALRALMA
jgi:lysophospholipase L1-like esterase